MFHPREILYVKTIAKELSFTKAGEKLFISQPALSQAVQKLEKRLGLPIFYRQNNVLELTPAGRLFVEYGQPVLDSVESLQQKMSGIVNIKEAKLRIGISQLYSEYHLSRFLPRFQKQYPGVSVELFEEKSARLEELTLDDTVDFCMVPLPLSHAKLEYQILQHEQILFAMPKDHPLKAQLTPSLSSNLPFMYLAIAKNEPFIFLKKQRFTEMGIRLCRDAGFEPKVRYETANWDTVRAFIANALGVGFLPEVMLSDAHGSNQPDCYRIIGENTTRPYAVVYKDKSRLSAAALSFIRIAQEVFQVP